jgi:hypothetical protein
MTFGRHMEFPLQYIVLYRWRKAIYLQVLIYRKGPPCVSLKNTGYKPGTWEASHSFNTTPCKCSIRQGFKGRNKLGTINILNKDAKKLESHNWIEKLLILLTELHASVQLGQRFKGRNKLGTINISNNDAKKLESHIWQ